MSDAPSDPAALAPPAFRERLRALASRPHFAFPPSAVPSQFRRSSVLVPFFPRGDDVHVLLTERSSGMSRHAGQMAFPGGLLEGDETSEQAALRETFEEVGIAPADVEVMGRLDDAWSGAGSHLVAVVAWLPEAPAPTPNPAEVERVWTPSVARLLRPDALSEEVVERDGNRFVNPILAWDGARAFGLTADLLLEALDWVQGIAANRGAARLRDLEVLWGEREAPAL